MRAWFSGALRVCVLGCFISCGPSQMVDRAQIATDAAPFSDGAGGSGGSGGTGGGPGWDGPLLPPDAPADAGSPDPDTGEPADAPAPDAPPPDAPPAPDVSPDTAPPLPFVSVSHAAAVASTGLSTAGTVDWRHWGHDSAAAVNRKRGGPGIISMVPIGVTSLARYNDRPVQFSWTDGWPTLAVTGTPDGIVVGDATGRGFEIRVTGDPARMRTIKAHLGVWGARGRLTVALSGQTGTIHTDDSLTATNPGADRIYTIAFQPAVQTQTLVLRWTVDSLNLRYGNVTMQAVSVAE